MSDFTIKEFREEDLPALAIHWKESIKGWPAGERNSNRVLFGAWIIDVS